MIKKLAEQSLKPALYEEGNAVMWTDEHISRQLLEVHLSEHTDLASRKPDTIRSTIDWIFSKCKGVELNILDLGCGPGLYTELLAAKGHHVTGVDFSANSIEYAKSAAAKKNLDAEYLCQDYTTLDLPHNKYDLVLLIYTDFCPLLPAQREDLLQGIKKALKPGGLFILDYSNDKNLQNKLSPKNWEAAEKGFWKDRPYLALSDSFLYDDEKVVLYQHIVIDDNNMVDVYRFWHHYFSSSDLENILGKHQFADLTFYDGVIPGGDGYNSEDITFCIAKNIKEN